MRGQALKIGAKKSESSNFEATNNDDRKIPDLQFEKNGAIYKQIGEKSKLIDSLLKERHLAC